MPESQERVRIRAGNEWLDGHDGQSYEWTADRASAWLLPRSQAETRLEKIKLVRPEAVIEETKTKQKKK